MIFPVLIGITVIPYAGIVRFRFKGYDLSPLRAPLDRLMELLYFSLFPAAFGGGE